MSKKYFLKNGEFIIKDYNNAKSFASFLPGIAGLYGRPMWAFYVNRGQCVASFGARDKNGAIMEFYPANIAYRRTPLEGFRTFIKEKVKGGTQNVYEPFRPFQEGKNSPEQTLYVSPHEFRIEEISKKHSLKTEVIYFTVPGEDFPALARILKITNFSSSRRELEVADGMPKVCPYGMNGFFMKEMARTIEAWMEVEGVEQKQPFYKLRTRADDTSRVEYITSGNFYLSVDSGKKKPEIVVDPAAVFGSFDDFTYPGKFAQDEFKAFAGQRTKNITPAAFSCGRTKLKHGEEYSILSVIGFAQSREQLAAIARKISTAFFDKKRTENRNVTESVSSSVSVFSGIDVFDAYTAQTNLDNILRGGYPVTLGDGGKTVYVYNRKHGDLERDYNNFTVNPEFFSQGNGNFRDANQNRRNSLWINPALGSKDIEDFYNLIQLDGFNPLVVKGDVFSLKTPGKNKKIFKKYFHGKDAVRAEKFFTSEFTPGTLAAFLREIKIKDSGRECFNEILKAAASRIDAEYGEGYWIDHWTYNLDLIESFAGIFPDKLAKLVFDEKKFMFFQDAHKVKNRSGRYVNVQNGLLRQYNSVYVDQEEKALIASRKEAANWIRTGKGKGDIYRCTLATKLLVLILNKMASIDPSGRGIEMEADKPGWCDSLNGLPGLLGSSVSEMAELDRTVRFFKDILEKNKDASVFLPEEFLPFFSGLGGILKKNTPPNVYWNKANALKEDCRFRTRFGLSGKEHEIDRQEAVKFLSVALKKLASGIAKIPEKGGVPCTYFIAQSASGAKKAVKNGFASRPLPLFLEGPTRLLKVNSEIARAHSLHKNIRKSPLYDQKLKMYRLNAPVTAESLDIGRTRVFTPGWLENESVWLHMEYKYLLEVLRSGLYKEFYEDFKNALIPFQPPARYGRSILENSSFLVSSSFSDEKLHGNGFVARLSGATAEFLHMLRVMNLGDLPFVLEGGKLVFKPKPVLDKMLFSKKERTVEFRFKNGKKNVKLSENSYAFNVFENTLIVYVNPKRKNTFPPSSGLRRTVDTGGVKPVRFEVNYVDGRRSIFEGDSLKGAPAYDLRDGKIKSVFVVLE